MGLFSKRIEHTLRIPLTQGSGEPWPGDTICKDGYTYIFRCVQTDNTRGRGNDRGYFKDYKQGVRVAVYDLVG